MADESSTPLLGESSTFSQTTTRTTTRTSTRRSSKCHDSEENTPLLSQSSSTPRYDGEEDYPAERYPSPAATSLRSLQNGGESVNSKKEGRRWPTIAAIAILGVTVIGIITGAFFAPVVVEEYAKESLVIEPTNLSIHEITSTGVVARVQANFKMDASKVKNKHISNIGRFGTWIAREVETTKSTVEVYVPSMDLLVGTAVIPRIVVNIRNGHVTPLDFLTELKPGNVEGLRQIANDWLDGRLSEITLRGVGDIGLKSGLFPLGSQTISEELRFEGSDIPSMPHYNITRMNFHEVPISTGGRRGMAADVSISLENEYPIGLTIPALGFEILVPNCGDEPLISLADAITGEIKVEPHSEVNVDVGGIVRELPDSLKKICPNSDHSTPLDLLLGDYLNGREATIYVRGSNSPNPSTPDWITKIISSITVPIPFPGHTFDNLIKEFHLDNTSFSLPSPFADEGSDEANPRISSDILVVTGMPKEMNFGIEVTGIKATADVKYKGKMMGILDLHKDWQKASSEQVKPHKGEPVDLHITSKIRNAPLRIKDEDVFEDVIAAYYFGRGVVLDVKAQLDIQVNTVLGEFVIRHMPAEASVPIKPLSRDGGFDDLKPKVGDISIISTDATTINLQAIVNFTNPTEYSAVVPYFNIHILCNGSIVGDATVRNISVARGNNPNIPVQATWDPTKFGGQKGAAIGRELLSQYISGFNTSLTFQLHEHSIPHQPLLGKALSKFAITIPTPRLDNPNDGGDSDKDKKPHFITAATFHVFSSTAQFTLVSPLLKSTIFIDSINATAYYNHTDPVGNILYDLPFMVPPGASESPKLPVQIDYDGVGYAQVRKALGGKLKLDARGTVEVRLGLWKEKVWYVGSGIGASVTW